MGLKRKLCKFVKLRKERKKLEQEEIELSKQIEKVSFDLFMSEFSNLQCKVNKKMLIKFLKSERTTNEKLDFLSTRYDNDTSETLIKLSTIYINQSVKREKVLLVFELIIRTIIFILMLTSHNWVLLFLFILFDINFNSLMNWCHLEIKQRFSNKMNRFLGRFLVDLD